MRRDRRPGAGRQKKRAQTSWSGPLLVRESVSRSATIDPAGYFTHFSLGEMVTCSLGSFSRASL